mgnify:CR=1 FL=1
MNISKFYSLLFLFCLLISCDNTDNGTIEEEDEEIIVDDCTTDQALDDSRGLCDVTLPYTNDFDQTTSSTLRVISTNSIPDHEVGLFGAVQGSLNPNAITEQSEVYHITLTPTIASELTPLLSSTGPAYSFGVLLNGVELDPVAAEPFPHEGINSPNANWEWNLEALNVNLGLDCTNAHVQPTGKYHYHGTPTSYVEHLNISNQEMTLIGYAADGFPIYYKYAYSNSDDNSSEVIEMTSSYQLKSGIRPGDGVTAPCDVYNGIYSNDYEYVEGLGTLDESNGRTGVTPEYPEGIYYYIVTEEFPSIPRYFKGTPSDDFRI